MSLDDDNQGFCKFVCHCDPLIDYLVAYPGHTVYGEWLVPHSLRTYRHDTWRKFYVFDVFDGDNYIGHFGIRLTSKAVTLSNAQGVSVTIGGYHNGKAQTVQVKVPIQSCNIKTRRIY